MEQQKRKEKRGETGLEKGEKKIKVDEDLGRGAAGEAGRDELGGAAKVGVRLAAAADGAAARRRLVVAGQALALLRLRVAPVERAGAPLARVPPTPTPHAAKLLKLLSNNNDSINIQRHGLGHGRRGPVDP